MQQLKQQFIINNKGRKTAVILPFHDYQQMLEDIHDLTIIAERKEEPNLSLADLKTRLKNNGLI